DRPFTLAFLSGEMSPGIDALPPEESGGSRARNYFSPSSPVIGLAKHTQNRTSLRWTIPLSALRLIIDVKAALGEYIFCPAPALRDDRKARTSSGGAARACNTRRRWRLPHSWRSLSPNAAP